ncbi:hypothetical protein [Nonomuraea typhae]|uniref:DUF2970 domain-containing protein n=1 Tax=Nonomuraea typhae TaxID=2603600 RepID=A0ABW7YTL5_9ACTN|nr:hypothetical protein [Nonomuraea typhae]
MDKVLYVLQKLLDANGGKMNGKFFLAIVVVAGLVVVGFIAFRLLMVEMILNLRG